MKKQLSVLFVCISVLFFFAQSAFAQLKKEKIKEEVFSYVDTVPDFVGGRDALVKYLTDNMEFPAKASKSGVKKGKVYVQFVVKNDGNIVNIEVEKTSDDVFNKEALRLVENMPVWKPGVLNSKQVNTRYTLPIKFGYSCPLDTK